jgi:hypothetical protein
MNSYEHKDARRGYEQSVDAYPEDYAWSEWIVYPEYAVGEHGGRRFIYVPMDEPEKQIFDRRRYRPLSRPTAALFLEFARWPETEGMDRMPLGSDSNEAAALEWAEINGVLGLSSLHEFTVYDEAEEAVEHSLGLQGAIHPRRRNEGNGGLEETVEAFAREAWVANMTLRLYEAATNPGGPEMETIAGCMSDREAGFPHLRGVSTLSLHGDSPEHARSWALRVVEEIVEDRMRGRIWPIPVRDLGGHLHGYAGHKQGWAFDSLLGAMWLQMMWLMLGRVRRCEWCGRLLDVDMEEDLKGIAAGGKRKPRSDGRFCRNNGRCRSKWNYHRGTGSSSKGARKENRDRRGL